jgi:fimbrial chaperone protein
MKRLCLFLLIFTLALPAFAFRFYPIVKSFSPTGPESTQNFYVENTGEARIAVQISIATRSMDETGGEEHADASGLFVVYPSQIILDPQARQTVRVQWLGDPVVEVEKAYRIIAEQLPIDFGSDDETGGQIDIMFRYMGALYVVPENPEATVSVTSARVVPGEEGPRLRLALANEGNAHTILRDVEIRLHTADHETPISLGGEDLSGVEGENMLADSRRVFEIPLPQGRSQSIREGPVRAEIDYTETR